jgi:HEAT repeats
MKLRIFCLVLLSVSLSVFLLTDCNCRQSLLVTQLLVDHVSGDDTFTLQRKDIRKICKKILSHQKNIKVKWDRSKNGVLRVRFQFLPVQEKTGAGQLMVSLKYSEITNQGLRQYFASSSLAVANTDEHRLIFERVFSQGMSELISTWQGEKQSSARLLEEMNEDWIDETVNENQLLQNIHLLGIKKEKKAVPILVKILLGRNEKAALASMVALTDIGDPDAVDGITKYAERKSGDVRKQAILAVRKMGGKKAAAWLFTLSTGHEDSEVRLAASEALKYVEEKLKNN